MKSSSFAIPIWALLLFSSCSFGVGSVSYELRSNIRGLGNPDVALVPQVADSYIGKLSPDPIFLNGYTQQLYLDKNPGSREAKPEDLVPEFSVYVGHVFLRKVTVSANDYIRDEIQYPMYPKQVTYTYKFLLSEAELRNALGTPANATIAVSSMTSTGFRIGWSKLTTDGADAVGIKYRAVVTQLGLKPTFPDQLASEDVDITQTDFSNLNPDTKYLVDVIYGDLKGHLGRLPQLLVKTDKVDIPTPPGGLDLAFARSSILGTWKGTMSCPWWQPTQVTVQFLPDGTYKCSSQTANQTAMYYGSDADSSEKTFSVISVNSNSSNVDFALYFGPGDTVMEHVRDLQVDGTNLRFSFLHRDTYGPISYELVRQ